MKSILTVEQLKSLFDAPGSVKEKIYAIRTCNGDKEILMMAMKDEHFSIRYEAVKACNGDKEILMMAVKDEHISIRHAAVEGCNGDKEILMMAMKDKHFSVRCTAVEGCNGDKEILMMAVKDEDSDVRCTAVEGCNGDKEILMMAMKDEHFSVRCAAVKACNGDKEILTMAMKDENSDVRCTAVEVCNEDKEIFMAVMKDRSTDYISNLFHANKPEFVYKKCLGNVILVATIPDDAFVRGNASTKCRANKADIVDIIGDFCGEKVGISYYDFETRYHIGDHVVIDNFDFSSNECAPGFHFFCSLEQAQRYNF